MKNKQPLKSVIGGLEAILNCKLEYTVNRRQYHSAKVLGLGISLVHPIPYDDDVIRFSEYDYEIMVEYIGAFDRSYSNKYRRIATIVLADMVSRNLNCECLVTEGPGDIILESFLPDAI